MAKEMKAVISLAGKLDSSLMSSISKAEGSLGKLKKHLQPVAAVGKAAAKAAAVVAGAAATATVAIAKESYSNYKETEQLVGGVESLYGDQAQTVIDAANTAYKRAGMSANEYMSTATSYAATLRNALGGDLQKSAAQSDKAILQMADNSARFGTELSSLQGTYNSLSRQQYGMLDNLKLGGPTRLAQPKPRENGETLARAA
jgi:phage-related protein